MSEESIRKGLEASIAVKRNLLANAELIATAARIAKAMVSCFKEGGKVLFCGNGGSAADAQHLSAELSGRYYFDRPPLFAEALHVNSSYLTAVGNDYGYDQVFSRLVRAQGRGGDVLVALSTSGNSANVLKALEMARTRKMVTVSFTGEGGGKMAALSDHLLAVPSKDTPRIQECHITLGHMICEVVERELFAEKDAS